MTRVANIWDACPRYWSTPIEPGCGDVPAARFVALAGTREWLDAYAAWFYAEKARRDGHTPSTTPVQLDLMEIPA